MILYSKYWLNSKQLLLSLMWILKIKLLCQSLIYMSTTNLLLRLFIMNSIYMAKRIFDSSIHSYQAQTLAISKELRYFFKKEHYNSIKFWEYTSWDKWFLYDIINKETKIFNLVPTFLCKSLWKFSRKSEWDEILNTWKMMFQGSDSKERYFLDCCRLKTLELVQRLNLILGWYKKTW